MSITKKEFNLAKKYLEELESINIDLIETLIEEGTGTLTLIAKLIYVDGCDTFKDFKSIIKEFNKYYKKRRLNNG